MQSRLGLRALSLLLAAALLAPAAGCARAQRSPERGGQQGGGGDQQGGRGGGREQSGGQRQDQPAAPNPNVAEGVEGMFGAGTSAIALGNSVLIVLPQPATGTAGAGGTGAPAAGNRGFAGPGDVGLRVRGQYPFVTYVYHVTDPAAAARVRAIAGEIRQGRPITAYMAELGRIMQAATPLPVGGAAQGTGGAGGSGAPAGAGGAGQ